MITALQSVQLNIDMLITKLLLSIRNEWWLYLIGKTVYLGLIFNKGIGQHILKNPLVITSMVDKVLLYFMCF